MTRSCWPTDLERLILQAGLQEGAAQTRALCEIEALGLAAPVPPGIERLLPLLFGAIRAEGGDYPGLLSLAEPAYLRAWQRSESMARHSARALGVLSAAGIPTLVLKGATLAEAWGDSALRPSSDLDVLVPVKDLAAAFEALRGAGWRPGEISAEDARLAHAIFLQGEGLDIDLHRHALEEFVGTGHDDALWDRAIPFQVLHAETRALAHGDRIIHACVHGLRWNPVPPVHWVADVLMLIRDAETEPDWHEIATRAVALEAAQPLREALAYLVDTFALAVPASALKVLAAARPSRVRALAFRARQRAPLDRGFVDAWAIRLERRRRLRLAVREEAFWPGVPQSDTGGGTLARTAAGGFRALRRSLWRMFRSS